MTCPKCGAQNRDDARFCGVCGTATSSTEPTPSPRLGGGPPEVSMIGREIAGRYRMLAKLGEGGMGAVYRAEQISLRRTVAVKLLRPEVAGSQMLLRRFNAEAEAVAKLSHPNTVGIYDFGQDTDGTLFIAMEHIDGRSLRSVIHAEAPLPLRRALSIAKQVAASLADAHAHAIVHRDLKPDNVMLQDRGRERDIARVLDFGIAKLRDDQRATQQQMTQQGDMLGTPQYMAPEQIRAEAIDGRTDVYALGCLLYEMVTARLPYEAPTVLAMLSKHLVEDAVPPSQRRPELGLPPAIDHLILRAMAKDPAARPQTMDELGEQIAALLDALPPDPRSAQRSAAMRPQTGSVASVPQVRAETPAAFSAYAPAPPPSAGAPYLPPADQAPTPAPGAASARPPSRKAGMIAIGAMLAAGAGIAALVIADHARSSPDEPATTEPPAHAVVDASTPDDPPAPKADAPEGADPWAAAPAAPVAPAAPEAAADPDHWGGTSAPEGDAVGIGGGIELVIPPGFQTTHQAGLVAAVDDRGVMIAGGPISFGTDDPKELAKQHARANRLTFESMDKIFVGGVQRPMGVFHGKVGGVRVRHVAVPLIGPGYRVFVMFQAPAASFTSDPAIGALLLELYTRRIVLPAGDP